MSGRISGNIPVPFPDENCYSILCRMAVRMGQQNTNRVCQDLFGNTEPLAGYIFKPFRLRNVQRWFGSEIIPYGWRYGADYSCYPFYTMFLNIEEAGMLRDSETASVLTSVQRKRVNQRCGFTRGHKQRLWYCPECSREDYMEYRETCWRRLPQIPGASYCPVHRIRLRESGVEFRDINYRLLPTTYALDHFPEPEEDIGNLYQSNFIRLAEDIAWLLNKGFSFSDNEWIKESFLELTGKPLQETLSTRANAKENEKRFEDYLINRLRRECGRDRIPVTIQKQIGTILSIEEAFGTVEEFFLA